VRTLYQYRQLLKQLKPVDEVMAPQLESILKLMRDGDEITPMTSEEKNRVGKTK
jgi:hypothetical protein